VPALLLDEPDSAPGVGAHSTGVSGDTPGPWSPDRQRAVLNALAVQLMRESPRLVRALATAQVLALGCTGGRARRCGWWLASTAAMLGALYVSSPSSVLALMLLAALVPSGLLLGASRSELAELDAAGWAGGYFPAGDESPRRARDGAAQPLPQRENGAPIIRIMSQVGH